MAHTPGRLARALRTSLMRSTTGHPSGRSSTPMSEALAIGLGLAPTTTAGRPWRDLPEWQQR